MNSVINKCLRLLLILMLFCTVASTCRHPIIPDPLNMPGASWDGNNRNSGFLGWYTNNTGIIYGVLTPRARERYNGLIDEYGNRFIPPLKKDYGIINNTTNFFITSEALYDFIKMNRWHKEEVK